MAEEVVNEWADGKFILILEKPLPDPEREGGKIERLVLREPNGGDMIEAGNPVSWNPAHEEEPFRVDERKMGAMISRLSAQPPSIIGKMSTRDMIRASNILGSFFLPF